MAVRHADTTATPDEAATGRAMAPELSHLLPALWRGLTVATRASAGLPALESQVSILRTLVEVGALTPAQLADALHLARPTISNSIRDLAAQGLVEKVPSSTDGRSVVVVPTDRGRQVLVSFRTGRLDVLENAIDHLSAADRHALAAALPTLDRLLAHLEAVAVTPA